MADHHIALSSIARDPIVAAFFARGERNTGPEPVITAAPHPLDITGGSAARPAFDHCAEGDDAFAVLNVHIGRGAIFLARELEDA